MDNFIERFEFIVEPETFLNNQLVLTISVIEHGKIHCKKSVLRPDMMRSEFDIIFDMARDKIKRRILRHRENGNIELQCDSCIHDLKNVDICKIGKYRPLALASNCKSYKSVEIKDDLSHG